MDVSPIGTSFNPFSGSAVNLSPTQQVQGANASEVSGLLTDSFGNPSPLPGLPAAPADGGFGGESAAGDASDTASMTALLAAYSASKSLTPVAMAYLASPPPSTTTTTYL